MRIAVTGATGFIGRYFVRRLADAGHALRCWYRPSSDRSDMDVAIEWLDGELNHDETTRALVSSCDAVVHAALWRPGRGFRGAEGNLVDFAERNVLGSLRLIEAARAAGVGRFIFVSTCAVHERILDDRPLNETHPTWATSHYGAHKAAIEQFVHSFGLGMNYPICALRPSGVYGLAHLPRDSKWFELVEAVVNGGAVNCRRGGKEVHAADVAKAVELLLNAPATDIAGKAFNCCDMYVSEWDVAHCAKRISGSTARITSTQTTPKNKIVTEQLQAQGMVFGGWPLVEATVRQMVEAVR